VNSPLTEDGALAFRAARLTSDYRDRLVRNWPTFPGELLLIAVLQEQTSGDLLRH
jgi:hypothetical protein